MTKITLAAQLLAYLPGEENRKAVPEAGNKKHRTEIDS
jgi:hypothetical protein